MTVLASGDREWTEELATTLAQAFRDDPAFCWLIAGDPDSRRQSLANMFPSLVATSLRSGFLRATPDGAAVSLWRKPEAIQPRLAELLAALPALLRTFGIHLPRALRLNECLHSNHPDLDAFYYLQYVAVRPDRQGRGLGREVINAGLSLADADAIPVVLETANPVNVPLYQRMGFEVLTQWQLTGAAPPFRTMVRAVPH